MAWVARIQCLHQIFLIRECHFRLWQGVEVCRYRCERASRRGLEHNFRTWSCALNPFQCWFAWARSPNKISLVNRPTIVLVNTPQAAALPLAIPTRLLNVTLAYSLVNRVESLYRCQAVNQPACTNGPSRLGDRLNSLARSDDGYPTFAQKFCLKLIPYIFASVAIGESAIRWSDVVDDFRDPSLCWALELLASWQSPS